MCGKYVKYDHLFIIAYIDIIVNSCYSSNNEKTTSNHTVS